MPVEETKPNEQTTPPVDDGRGKSDDFDKADYTRKTQRLSAIEQEAAELGYDDPVQAIKDLRRIAEQKTTTEQPPANEPAKKPPVEDDNVVSNALREISMANARIQLEQMRIDYNMEQRELPEDKREVLNKKEFMDYVALPENARAIANVATVEQKAGKEGNWAAIAARMIKKEKLATQVIKEKAESKEATDRAADGTKMVTTEAPEAGKPENKNPAQARADKISPDTRKKFD